MQEMVKRRSSTTGFPLFIIFNIEKGQASFKFANRNILTHIIKEEAGFLHRLNKI
jgi:hypothetical protein